MSSLISLSEEQLAAYAETAEKIAQEVAKNSLEAVSHRLNIVGPHASIGEKKNGLYITPGQTYIGESSNSHKNSYIFNGLQDTRVVIHEKVNHVLIRECRDCRFLLSGGVISGVTILRGRKVGVDLPIQNTTSVEETAEADIHGEVTQDTIIYISGSLDIVINHERMHVHPFVQGVLRQGYFFPTRYNPPQLQSLL
jgi:hypothetical protein